jgi:RIO kinase 1
VRVPYPVQLDGTEVLLEFIGDWETGEAAPRLAQVRTEPSVLRGLWEQMTDALSVLARAQVAHGDLSPYNTLVHEGRLVLIDLPQIVDVVANPQGADFIARDVKNVATWFAARGLDVDPEGLLERLLYEAGLK